MKFAYSYDNEGNYIGLTPRQISPLEEGVWLLPAMSTDKEPPTPTEGMRVKFSFDTGEWTLEEIPPPPPPEPSEPEPSEPEPSEPNA